MEKRLVGLVHNGLCKRDYGMIGDKTSKRGVRIGDLVSYGFNGSCTPERYFGIVVKSKDLPFYSVMGSLNSNILEHEHVKVVVPHDLITKEIANCYNVDILEPKEMTLKEIEEALGYPIEIIEK